MTLTDRCRLRVYLIRLRLRKTKVFFWARLWWDISKPRYPGEWPFLLFATAVAVGLWSVVIRMIRHILFS